MHWSIYSRKTGTWTAGRIGFILLVSFIYGIWFNAIDSVSYCFETSNNASCKSIGQIFGGNIPYQLWNIVGHSIPSLLLFIFYPTKFELFLAAFLISTVVMDSPLWGVMRIGLHGGALWADDAEGNQIETNNFFWWVAYYYDPFGFYLVWDESWLFDGFPNAAAIFWSLIGRITGAFLLIWWQNRQELEGREFSLLRPLKGKS